MKNLLLFSFVVYTFSALASDPKSLVKQLENLNSSKATDLCASSSEDENQVYLPADALKDINAGNLTFLGRDLSREMIKTKLVSTSRKRRTFSITTAWPIKKNLLQQISRSSLSRAGSRAFTFKISKLPLRSVL